MGPVEFLLFLIVLAYTLIVGAILGFLQTLLSLGIEILVIGVLLLVLMREVIR